MKFVKLDQSVMGQMFRPQGALYEYRTDHIMRFWAIEEIVKISDKLTPAFGPGTRYSNVEEVVEANTDFHYDVNRHIWYYQIEGLGSEPELFLTTEDQLLYLIMSMEHVELEDKIVG